MEPIDWIDFPTQTKERTVLTQGQLGVPGVQTFGYHGATCALAPLVLHYHKNCFEFTYIVKGSILFAAGGKNYVLPGGSLFLTQPNEPHDTGSTPLSVNKMFWFQLKVDDPSNFLYLERSEAKDLIDSLQQIKTHVISLDSGKAKLILDMIFEFFQEGSERAKREGAALLVFSLYRILESEEKTRFTLTPDIERAVNYILDHITEELRLEELAHISMLSESRFKQKFKLQIGITPREYINSRKIEEAKLLLLKNLSVTTVAMQLGFSSSNYFSVVFKRFTFYSPEQYINKYRQKE